MDKNQCCSRHHLCIALFSLLGSWIFILSHISQQKMKRGIWISYSISALGLLFFFFNPSNTALFPKCPFLLLTGWKCPGCGSQRAIHHLLHLQISEAFLDNALLIILLPLLLVFMVIEYGRTSLSRLRKKINHPLLIWLLLSIIGFWWIFRNIYSF